MPNWSTGVNHSQSVYGPLTTDRKTDGQRYATRGRGDSDRHTFHSKRGRSRDIDPALVHLRRDNGCGAKAAWQLIFKVLQATVARELSRLTIQG